MEQGRAENLEVVKLVAYARIHEAVSGERKADMLPKVSDRLERQYINFPCRNSGLQDRLFLGLSTQTGGGLSIFANVTGELTRYEAALVDVEITKLGLDEQITSDYWQAEADQKRALLLVASLALSASIRSAWDRQFLAGHKTWLDVMNIAWELAQLAVQLAEVSASQLVLTWHQWVIGRGVNEALSKNSKLTAGQSL